MSMIQMSCSEQHFKDAHDIMYAYIISQRNMICLRKYSFLIAWYLNIHMERREARCFVESTNLLLVC